MGREKRAEKVPELLSEVLFLLFWEVESFRDIFGFLEGKLAILADEARGFSSGRFFSGEGAGPEADFEGSGGGGIGSDDESGGGGVFFHRSLAALVANQDIAEWDAGTITPIRNQDTRYKNTKKNTHNKNFVF